MPVSNVSFGDPAGNADPYKKVTGAFEKIRSCSLDVTFQDRGSGASVLSRDYIEMIIEDYSLAAQDQASFNKWIQLDTDIEKALMKFKSELVSLMSGMSSVGIAQTDIQSSTGIPGPSGADLDLTSNKLGD